LSEQPAAPARRWRLGRTLLVAAMLAGLAVVLFATSALSRSSGSSGSSGGAPAVEQVRQTPGDGDRGKDCPNRSGQNQPSEASQDV
jgi:hypothetical protein